MLMLILLILQLLATGVMTVYFLRQLHRDRREDAPHRPSHRRETERLHRMKAVSLTQPLAEQVRPAAFADLIGQADGVKSLEAILCGANPQHVLIYGPPGVGKTCAARLVLEKAKSSPGTPFGKDAPFIECDATCMRFDERAIANPLIGSVHDPIYQGAGHLGAQGVPQPKPGAVTKAHGGVLFLDEIGELHPTQMNALLKVLEDRRVKLESAYYNPDDRAVPPHIHEIFRDGLPADFRLIGATTRNPQELPEALRSRCMEVFFRALEPGELAQIASGAAIRAGFTLDDDLADTVGRYAACGRDAVNMVQMAAGLAQMDNRRAINKTDLHFVIRSGRYVPHGGETADLTDRIGCVHGLAVGGHRGAVLDVEALVTPGTGRVHVTGIIDAEEIGDASHRVHRKSSAACAGENVRTLLLGLGCDLTGRDVHINFPGAAPVDGPSAGCAMAVAAVSALNGQSVDGRTAITGEITVRGAVRPVGGIPDKIDAARRAGLTRVLIPSANAGEAADADGVEVIPVDSVATVLRLMLTASPADAGKITGSRTEAMPLAAAQKINI